MFFEEAISVIKKNGGYMYREVDIDLIRYYIDGYNNKFMKAYNSRFENDRKFNIHSEVDRIFGADLVADDWRVDLTGCWKDQ
jgi:hypothetical protein